MTYHLKGPLPFRILAQNSELILDDLFHNAHGCIAIVARGSHPSFPGYSILKWSWHVHANLTDLKFECCG